MNATQLIYTEGEQAALSIAGLVLCPLLSIPAYIVSRWRSEQASKSLKSRAYLFYMAISGVLIGQFIGHTKWAIDCTSGFATWGSFLIVTIFVAVGWYLLDTCEAFARVWNTNPNMLAPSDYNAPDDIALNRSTMEEEEVVVTTDPTSNDFSNAVFLGHDKFKDKTKRRWMLGVLFVLFAAVCFVNGLYLVYQYPVTPSEKTQIIICYYANAILMSTAIYGAMIHARIHVMEEKRFRLITWFGLSALWSIIFFGSALMVLVRMEWILAFQIIHSEYLIAFYGVASGAILKMQQYFHNMKSDGIDCSDTIFGRFILFITMGASVVVSVWL